MTAAMTAVTRAWPERALPGAGGRVVVGVDDTPGGLTALRCAIGLARSSGAPLVAVRAWALGLPRHGGLRFHPGRAAVALTFRGTEPGAAARSLAARAFRAVDGDVPDDLEVTIETPEGNPGPVLTQAASGDGDVLVVGTTHGPRLKRAVHGSVSAYCTEYSRCPVTVVAAGRPRRGRTSRDPVPAK